MVALARAVPLKATGTGQIAKQAKPSVAVPRVGPAKLSAVSPNGVMKITPAFVGSRRAARCDQGRSKGA